MSITKLRRNMSRWVRPFMYGVAAVFIGSIFTMYLPQFRTGKPAGATERVVARVNGEEIPRDAYERAVQIAIRQIDMRAQMGNSKASLREYHLARGQGFEAIVDSYLRSQAAEREGIRVSGADIQKVIDDEIELELDRVTEGATPQERKQYKQQLQQLADEETVRRRLLNEQLTEKLRERFAPTEADLMASYNEVKVRHILFRTQNRTPEEAQKLAEDALAKIKGGANFEELAKKESEDTNSKSQGGDVGWITSNSGFVPEFTEAARQLKKGEVSGVVQTMFGFHILKADDVRTKVPKDIQKPERKKEYLDTFAEQTVNNKMNSYFASLRFSAEIDPIDPFIAGYIAENKALSSQGDSSAEAQKLMAQAIKHYEAAAARNDLAAGPALYAKLAELYNMTKQDDKALVALSKALEGSPSAEMFMTQGEIHQRRKDKAAAVKSYEEAFKVADNQPWLFIQLQQEFKKLGREDLAKKSYAKWEDFKNNGSKTGQFMPGASLPPLPISTKGE